MIHLLTECEVSLETALTATKTPPKISVAVAKLRRGKPLNKLSVDMVFVVDVLFVLKE